MEKLMVIDGNSIINRAFYGVHMLTTKGGTPTNAVYGFLSILQKLLDEEQPEALCVCFDMRAPTFRHLAYEGYKAHRKGMPEELTAQMPIMKDVLTAMNIPWYEMEGWEADDLIGTIAKIDTAAGWETIVVTGDKDSLQLVTETTAVKLVTTRMGQTTTKLMTPAAFRAEYGFEPAHIVDLKALMGDASDNIPGVKGIGEKTAMGLIQMYGTVDALYDHMPEVETAPGTPAKPGMIQKLEAGRDMARMSYSLATIQCDAPLEFAPEAARRQPVNRDALYQIFLRLEFSKLIDKMGLSGACADGSASGASALVSGESEVLTDQARQDELLGVWRAADAVVVLATTSLDVVAVEWVDAGIHRVAVSAAALSANHGGLLRSLFAPDIKKISHDVKVLMNALLGEGLGTDGFVFDTAIAEYLLASTEGSYDLERLSMSYFSRECPKEKDYLDPAAFGALSDPVIPVTALVSRCAVIRALYGIQVKRLGELGMNDIFYNIELPLCAVLAEMERTGFMVDQAALSAFGEMLSARIDLAQGSIYEMAGETFNINSPKQLGVILFETLQLPSGKKTKTGYSTNVEVLEKLKGRHPIIDAILEYRQLTKLKSTYVDGLSRVIGADGRIHTSFQNTVTATGRLSSTEPNLQNIPVRTELGAELRKMFVPADGCVLVDADYSQIELRLLAHIADDATMREAFCSGVDVHTVTASQVFNTPVEEVTHEMRRRAKAVNFGIVYGISEFSLSQDIGVSRAEGKEYMDRYFETYGGVKAYMSSVVDQAKKDGYVATLSGRRRWLPELKSSNFNMRTFGERVALNMPIQGTAADVIKLAMVHVARRLKADGLRAHLVLQVHDELILECPESEVDQVKALLTEEMEHVMVLSVPLKADSAAGRSWAEAKS